MPERIESIDEVSEGEALISRTALLRSVESGGRLRVETEIEDGEVFLSFADGASGARCTVRLGATGGAALENQLGQAREGRDERRWVEGSLLLGGGK